MRTSLNNIKTIDNYLLGRMARGEAVVFEANMLLNSDLMDDVSDQQNTHSIVKEYGRLQLKKEIMAVQKALATAPQHRGFMQRISNLFGKHQ
jgi:hypothetical protein